MTKTVTDAVLDGALEVAATADRIFVCAGAPTNYTEASATNNLGSITITSGSAGADFTISNGDTSGRKLRVTAQTGATVSTSGTADHLAVCDSGTTSIRFVTEVTSQALTSGNTFNTPAFDYEIGDPT